MSVLPLLENTLVFVGWRYTAENGHHGLACRRSAGRHRRHALGDDVVVRAIRSIGVLAGLEPARLLRGEGKRPDGATLDHWNRGQ